MPNILLVTAIETETQAVFETLREVTGNSWLRIPYGNETYYDLGLVGGAKVYLVQSEMGAVTPGGAILTVSHAIAHLNPACVIMVGIAFGARPASQKMGDILVSRQMMSYEPGKVVKSQFIPRGNRVTASTALLSRFRSGKLDWRGDVGVHFGLVLSGEKLVNDQIFLNELLDLEQETIGGEMEGAGLFAAASDAKVDWILVKAICDWADGAKNDAAQSLAARNAAKFVCHVLQQGHWEELATSPERADKKTMVQLKIKGNVDGFNKRRQRDLVVVISALLGIDQSQITIKSVVKGSIAIILEMPSVAADLLYEMAESKEAILMNLEIQAVLVEGLPKIELTKEIGRSFNTWGLISGSLAALLVLWLVNLLKQNLLAWTLAICVILVLVTIALVIFGLRGNNEFIRKWADISTSLSAAYALLSLIFNLIPPIINVITPPNATATAPIVAAVTLTNSPLPPTLSLTPTVIATTALSPTSTITLTPTPVPCLCALQTEDETARCLIASEAQAANQGSLDMISRIFAPNVTIYRGDTKQTWKSAQDYYQPAFAALKFSDAIHFDITQVKISGETLFYTSGSSGKYIDQKGNEGSYNNVNPSEHWIIQKNDRTCWVVTRYDFNDKHDPFPSLPSSRP